MRTAVLKLKTIPLNYVKTIITKLDKIVLSRLETVSKELHTKIEKVNKVLKVDGVQNVTKFIMDGLLTFTTGLVNFKSAVINGYWGKTLEMDTRCSGKIQAMVPFMCGKRDEKGPTDLKLFESTTNVMVNVRKRLESFVDNARLIVLFLDPLTVLDKKFPDLSIVEDILEPLEMVLSPLDISIMCPKSPDDWRRRRRRRLLMLEPPARFSSGSSGGGSTKNNGPALTISAVKDIEDLLGGLRSGKQGSRSGMSAAASIASSRASGKWRKRRRGRRSESAAAKEEKWDTGSNWTEGSQPQLADREGARKRHEARLQKIEESEQKDGKTLTWEEVEEMMGGKWINDKLMNQKKEKQKKEKSSKESVQVQDKAVDRVSRSVHDTESSTVWMVAVGAVSVAGLAFVLRRKYM